MDAARATVLDFGVRRATLTEVARRAGVSRMTVYRRYSDAAELMRALLRREFEAVLAEVQGDLGDVSDALEQLVSGVQATLLGLIRHPLMLRVLELEPELMLPFVTVRIGQFQTHGRALLAGRIASGQRHGTVRPGDPEVMAATLEMMCRGVILAAHSFADEPAREAAVDDLMVAVRSYLSPAAELTQQS